MEHTIEQRFEALRVSTPFCEDYTNSPAKAITRRNIIKKHLDNVFGAYGSVESRERLRLKFDLYFDIEACTDGMKLPDALVTPTTPTTPKETTMNATNTPAITLSTQVLINGAPPSNSATMRCTA